MNSIHEHLLDLTGRLELPSGTLPDTLAVLRRSLAASFIQNHPGVLPVEPDPALDPKINEAAAEGVRLAAELAQSRTRLRIDAASYLFPTPSPHRPARLFGPFLAADGSLVRFAAFESAPLLRVSLVMPAPFPYTLETLMLLPPATASEDGQRTFNLPAGTVWLRARFLVAGATGYVGLRIRRGTLEISRPALRTVSRAVGVLTTAQWKLTLEPEPTEATEPAATDADALGVRPPARLEVHSTGAPTAHGPLAVSGFGAELELAQPAGAPFVESAAVVFPYDVTGAEWSIAGNRSAAAELAGTCPVLSAGWSLPRIATLPDTLGEAAHAGSIVLRLGGDLQSHLRGASGTFRWFDSILIANTEGIELEARQADASARIELELWGPARSSALFAQQPISYLRFASRRGGPDVAAIGGGELRNRWDLPLAAAGEPFPFEGTVELLAVVAERSGRLRVAWSATAEPAEQRHGVALENLYLTVGTPRRLALVGDFDGESRVSGGVARLTFDVMLAQPTLPDPYAASWTLPREMFAASEALSIALRWSEGGSPALGSRLERAVPYPGTDGMTPDDEGLLREMVVGHLGSYPEGLSLLDLSSADQHFGVALESLSEWPPQIDGNRLSTELRRVRLLMQPQVHWEPVEVVPSEDAAVHHADVMRSVGNGGRTLAGSASVELVPVLPGLVCRGIADTLHRRDRGGVVFSLPFGLRAFARFDESEDRAPPSSIPPIEVSLHEPHFGELTSARQLRLVATGSIPLESRTDPTRGMPGSMIQLHNLVANANGLDSVLSGGVDTYLDEFREVLPLHHADLSGYGLSTFSDWHRDVDTGVTQVRFDVLNGRTSYQVIQVRSVLVFCMAPVVRTIVLERRNSGQVLRFDSGWQPVADGLFRFQDGSFEKGVVKAFRNLRRIRILARPRVRADGAWWQPVKFQADAELDDVVAGGGPRGVPIREHAGYVLLGRAGIPTRARLAALLARIGTPVGGPIDCTIRLGGTLEMKLNSIVADDAPRDNGTTPALVLAAYGAPRLPRAGQWSAVRVDGTTGEAAPVDPRHGVPVVRRPGRPYAFRAPGDVQRTARDEYGWLMATPTSRVLFPIPTVDPNGAGGEMRTAAARVADPMALIQASSSFPRAAHTLRCTQAPVFAISGANHWRLTNGGFSFEPPAAQLASGAEWGLGRAFPGARTVNLTLDSASPGKPWGIDSTPNDLVLAIPPFGEILTIRTRYEALSGTVPALQLPTLEFGPVLSALRDVVDALKHFVDLDFDVDVDVTAGTGPSPEFVTRVRVAFAVGKPTERVDIGIGKFYGELQVRGELAAGLGGATRTQLSLEFQGDIQQGIIPPLVYAGGFFRFAIQLLENGRPRVELGLATVASIGGDLIPGLVSLEVTVKYGYTLIPDTLQPGVLLGLDARAKLLSGLIGFSFSVQAMARIQRLDLGDKEVEIWAEIRVAATVQVAWLIEEEVDFETQFEQRIPLAPVLALKLGPAALLL